MSTSSKSGTVSIHAHDNHISTSKKGAADKITKNQHKSPSPLPTCAPNINNNNGVVGLSSLTATLDSGSSSYNNPLKRSSTSPIAATNGSIPSIAETLNGQSMLSSMFPTPSELQNSVANLALMQQLHNSSLMSGFPTGLESLFRGTPSVPPFSPSSFNPFAYPPSLPSPAAAAAAANLFSSPSPVQTNHSANHTSNQSNGEPASKKPFDPLYTLRNQLGGSGGSLNGSLLSNGGSPNITTPPSQPSTANSHYSSSSSSGSKNSSSSSNSSSQKSQHHNNSVTSSGGVVGSNGSASGTTSRSSPSTRSANGNGNANGNLSNGLSSLSSSSGGSTTANSSAAKMSPPNLTNLLGSPGLNSSGTTAVNGTLVASGVANNLGTNSTSTSPKSETDSIRSLVKSYRESAAFLNRSADELEKLLSGTST